MIAIALGGARCVWEDLAAAETLLAGRPYLVIACNEAGRDYPGRLDAWVSLHPDKLLKWSRARVGSTDCKMFAHIGRPGIAWAGIVTERWKGSSGLYMAQIALDHLGATAVIFCGVPLDAAQAHYHDPKAWKDAEGFRGNQYRRGFRAAASEIGSKLRSMSGWTAELLGTPDSDWLTERAQAHR